MFCAECGQRLADGTNFCPHCGTPVARAPGTEPPRPAPNSNPGTASDLGFDAAYASELARGIIERVAAPNGLGVAGEDFAIAVHLAEPSLGVLPARRHDEDVVYALAASRPDVETVPDHRCSFPLVAAVIL